MAIAAPGKLNVTEVPAWGSRDVHCFEKLDKIGEGSYGQVHKARENKTGEIVALKKILMGKEEKEGFPITAIREIKKLQKLHHKNVINLKEIVTDQTPAPDGNKYKGETYMVFEYMNHDLTGLACRHGRKFSVPQIKCFMKQLLTGLHYCHVKQVLHRDIKCQNILIDNEGNLKLADFGLARSFSEGNLTNRVVTLWYRPPELLLGATKYGPAVDMWSVGCVFAELLNNGKPIFRGKELDGSFQADQLNKVFDICGTPSEEIWPGVSKLPWYNNFRPARIVIRRLREHFGHFDRHALDLLERMLTLDPSLRISARDALDAEYFWTDPLPCDPKSLPTYEEASHEFQTRNKRQQQRQQEENAKRQHGQGSVAAHYPPQRQVPPYNSGLAGAWPPRGGSLNYPHGGAPYVASGAGHGPNMNWNQY